MGWVNKKLLDQRLAEGMALVDPSLWPADLATARSIQNTLRHQVRIEDDFGIVKTIAGVDVGYDMERNLGRASIVVVDGRTMEPVASAQAYLTPGFPYVPGFLSFREVPVILRALACLDVQPDLLMVDGQGVAHPRRFGIAAHLGVETGLPSIGVAKSLLTGVYSEPEITRGARTMLRDKVSDERIGTVLRSKDNVKVLFVSPGHRVGQDSAVEIVERCLRGYRLPEPTRLADKFSKTLKEKHTSAETGLLF